MADRDRRRYMNAAYVNGSAAPALPERRTEERRRVDPEAVDRTRTDLETRVLEKRENGKRWAFGHIAAIVLSALFAASLITLYLLQLSDYRAQSAAVTALRKTYQETLQENNLTENRQDASVDYVKVYAYATEVLGMRLPEKQQVVRYRAAGTEYVSKLGDIPNE